MIKKIVIKICLLILITIGLNIIYNLTFYKKDSTINEMSPLIRLNYS